MKQFDLTSLPKLTRAELDFQRAWPRFAPNLESMNALVGSALENIDKSITLPRLELKAARLERRDKLIHFFDDQSLHTFGTFTNTSAAFALSTPKTLAKELVYALLGAHSSSGSPSNQLTEIEKGIFAFIVASISESVQMKWPEHVFMRLSSLKSTAEASSVFTSTQLIELLFEAQLSDVSATVRLILEADTNLFAQFTAVQDRAHVDTGLSLAGDTPVSIRLLLGEASLLAKDLHDLQVDNVLVLDKAGAMLENSALSGVAQCQIGANSPPFSVRLFALESNNYAIKLDTPTPESPL